MRMCILTCEILHPSQISLVGCFFVFFTKWKLLCTMGLSLSGSSDEPCVYFFLGADVRSLFLNRVCILMLVGVGSGFPAREFDLQIKSHN